MRSIIDIEDEEETDINGGGIMKEEIEEATERMKQRKRKEIRTKKRRRIEEIKKYDEKIKGMKEILK